MYRCLLLIPLPPLNGNESLRKRAAPTRCITEEIKRKCKQSNEGTEFIYVD
ncbi:hypothetical protein AB4K20DRAFT_1921830, partial [Rhizopus microsporus]